MIDYMEFLKKKNTQLKMLHLEKERIETRLKRLDYLESYFMNKLKIVEEKFFESEEMLKKRKFGTFTNIFGIEILVSILGCLAIIVPIGSIISFWLLLFSVSIGFCSSILFSREYFRVEEFQQIIQEYQREIEVLHLKMKKVQAIKNKIVHLDRVGLVDKKLHDVEREISAVLEKDRICYQKNVFNTSFEQPTMSSQSKKFVLSKTIF